MRIEAGGYIERLSPVVRRLVGRSWLRRPLGKLHRAFLKFRGVCTVRVNGEYLRFLPGSEPAVTPPDPNWPKGPQIIHLADYVLVAFCSAIRPGDEVADVGAFKGSYSVLAALVGKTGHVTAFEPSAENRVNLVRNLQLNDLEDRVTVCDRAVSSGSGESAFFSVRVSNMNSLVLDALPPDQREAARLAPRSVRTTALDSYFAERKRLPRVLYRCIRMPGRQQDISSGAPR